MSKVRRVWRSKEARSVRDALLCYAERGVLADFNAGKLRLGRMTFTVLPHAGRTYRLLLDVDAGTLHLSGLLPGIRERSSLFRELKSLLLRLAAGELSPMRLDLEKGELQLLEDSVGITLAMRVRDSEYEYCARRLLDCANEISRAFADTRSHSEEVRGVTQAIEALH